MHSLLIDVGTNISGEENRFSKVEEEPVEPQVQF
jgi:hypothetical protein